MMHSMEREVGGTGVALVDGRQSTANDMHGMWWSVWQMLRVDIYRSMTRGAGLMVGIIVAVPLLLVAISWMGEPAAMSGALAGMLLGWWMVLPLNLFVYEVTGGHRWMNGVVPATRGQRVLARYVFGIGCALFVMAQWWCFAPLMRGHASMNATQILVAGVGYAAVMVCMQSVSFPLLYRFRSVKVAGYIISCCVLVTIAALAAFSQAWESLSSGIDLVMGWIADYPTLSACIAGIIVIGIWCVSMYLSYRITHGADE